MECSKNLHRELFCVLFPGLVKDEKKALQYMGGIKGISQVYSQANKKRLGLSFQPENPFIKKIYGDAKPTSGVLLKLKIRKTKCDNGVKREVVSTSVVGSVTQVTKFESLCDFQYMPVSTSAAEKHECILDQILPTGVDDINTLTEPVPAYITPLVFTRSDRATNYSYSDKRYGSKDLLKEESTDGNNDEVHKSRNERALPISRYVFNLEDDLPTKANEYYLKQKDIRLSLYPKLEEEYQILKELFEERPIWSLNLVKYRTKIKMPSLKILLPCIALYMREGPWRMMWVKFGYDPRKNSDARKYQTLDFRMRHSAGVHVMIMTRDQVVHCKKTDRVRNTKKYSTDDISQEDIIYEGAVYFKPGMTPTQRQVYYQYCDVHLPEVQELISKEPPVGYKCHEKRGWLLPDTDQLCRDCIFQNVKQTLLATHKADLKFDVGSSGDDSSSDENGASTSVVEADESLNI